MTSFWRGYRGRFVRRRQDTCGGGHGAGGVHDLAPRGPQYTVDQETRLPGRPDHSYRDLRLCSTGPKSIRVTLLGWEGSVKKGRKKQSGHVVPDAVASAR